MKVLYIATADSKYGAAKTQIDMIMELKKNYAVVPVVLTKKHNSVNDMCDELGIENYSYWYRDIMAGSAYSSCLLNFAKHIVKYMLYIIGGFTQRGVLKCGIDWNTIDIIHSNHIRIDIGAYISRKTGIPHIWHIKELNRGHVRIVHYKPNCYRYINKNADLFLAVTNQVKEYWCEAGLTSEKVKVVYEGIDTSKFIEKERRVDDSLRMICVGRIEKSKGQMQILQAMTKLSDDIREKITLDLVGEPYPDYMRLLHSYIYEHHLEKQVNFLGYQDDIPTLLSHYDVGILSSRGDAFGTVVAEYMAAGLLPIATYTELVEHRKTGLRYCFDDVGGLAENIRYAYVNREECMAYAHRGRQLVKDHFSSQKNAEQVAKTYELLLEKEAGNEG